MDQALSAVVIAVITGFFSVITMIIQKRQDRVLSKIEEQNTVIDKEKALKQKLNQKEKEREMIIHEIMILILDTNLDILKSTQYSQEASDKGVYIASDNLKERFNKVLEEIKELVKEYEMLIELTAQIQEELEEQNSKRKGKK